MPVRPLSSLGSILSLVFGLTLSLALVACGSGSASTAGAQLGTTPAASAPPAAATATPAPAVTETSTAVATAGPSSPVATAHVMPASPAATPSAVATSSSPATGEVQVQIVNFAFEPATITIKPGTTVVWTNTSPTQHTTTSRQPANVWDSGIMEPGAVFRFTFQQAGEFDYWCALHPDMLGKVIVQP